MKKNEKLKIPYPIICEGKYDKITLDSVVEGNIIPLNGFRIFNDKEKRLLLRRLCEGGRVIVLTDSDRAGTFIRSYLRSVLPPESLINIYTPRIEGKEKRKATPSADGILGVEGMKSRLLYELLLPYASEEVQKKGELTKADMYALGLSGRDSSSELRERVAAELSLPPLCANALLQTLNMLCTRDEITELVEKIKKDKNKECGDEDKYE